MKRKPSQGRNRPPLNSRDASWLPIVEKVHREMPEVIAEMKRRRTMGKYKRGSRGPQPRKKRA